MHVLEAVMIAIMMFVAISFTSSFTLPTYREPYGRRQLESTAADKLQNLYRITPQSQADRFAYGNLLMKYITEAALGNSANLSAYVKAGLEDVQFNVYLGNGYGRIPIYIQGIPPGDAVSASQIITAPWSYTMVFTDLDVYDTVNSTQMTLWAIPVYKSSVVKNLSCGVPVVFSNNVTKTLTEKTPSLGLYEKTGIPPETLNSNMGYDTTAPTNVRSSLTYRGVPLSGGVNYTIMSIAGGVLKTLIDSLHQNCSLSIAPHNVTIDQTINMSYNFSGLSRFQNITINIYSPMMGKLEKKIMFWGKTGSYSYTISRNSVYGPYVVEAEARVLFGDNNIPVTARLIDYFVVTLPDGSQPSSPAYDVQLVMWYPEW